MKQNSHFRAGLFISMALTVLIISACNQQEQAPGTTAPTEKTDLSKQDMISRGGYLVTIGGCGDCHSPKKMTNMGPVADSAKFLSGHPADSKLPPIDLGALKPGSWSLMGPGVTAFVGPWGISFSANLTPDSATGIGAWSEEVFIKTLQTGKHLGQPNGRDILPPMPWTNFIHMTDTDIKSMYAYLQSIPAVSNRVPSAVPPTEVPAMAGK